MFSLSKFVSRIINITPHDSVIGCFSFISTKIIKLSKCTGLTLGLTLSFIIIIMIMQFRTRIPYVIGEENKIN